MTKIPSRKTAEKTAVQRNTASDSAPIDPISGDVSPPKQPSLQISKKPIQADGYRTIYANFSKVGITQWDLTLIVGQLVENKDGENINEEAIAIRFSPQYFKVMANSLNLAIKQWEETFGEVPLGLGHVSGAKSITKAFSAIRDSFTELENQEKSEND